MCCTDKYWIHSGDTLLLGQPEDVHTGCGMNPSITGRSQKHTSVLPLNHHIMPNTVDICWLFWDDVTSKIYLFPISKFAKYISTFLLNDNGDTGNFIHLFTHPVQWHVTSVFLILCHSARWCCMSMPSKTMASVVWQRLFTVSAKRITTSFS